MAQNQSEFGNSVVTTKQSDNNKMQSPVTDLFKKKLYKMLLKWTLWDGVPFDTPVLQRTAEKQAPQDEKAKALYIVSRQHYQELVKQYPIESERELRKVLAQEHPADNSVFHLIAPAREQKRSVTTYRLKSGVTDNVKHWAVILPESLLVGLALPETAVAEVESPGGNFFIARFQGQVRSHLKNSLCRDLNQFKILTGMPEEIVPLQISALQLQTYLQSGIEKLSLRHWLSLFFLPKKSAVSVFKLKPLLSIITVIVVGYMAAASFYLQSSIDHYDHALQALGQEIDVLLDQQQKTEQRQQDALKLQTQFSTNYKTAQLWLTVGQLLSVQDIELQGISFQDGRLTVRGRAPSATKVLESFSASRDFHDARFDASVSRQDNLEFFVISAAIGPLQERSN